MPVLMGGVAVCAATPGIFAYGLPRSGRPHRYVGTEPEPYIAVAFRAGFAMILASILDLMGQPLRVVHRQRTRS